FQVFSKLVLPLTGFLLTVWLWTSLSGTTLIVGLCWLAVGFVWLAGVTRGFQRPTPVLDMKE
nr:Putrescine importer PuuP [Streptomyces sp. DSM 41633]